MIFRRIPHTYVIVFYIILAAAVLTWIIPGGEYIKQIYSENGIKKSPHAKQGGIRFLVRFSI